ncbi:hypothetical protein ABVK25_006084 [Lepraria finkii]|uniref:asparagine--tRNA ligase n=1 Tax=Lepraria finkii TaxID=1340010 RepID=A0ABR4BAB4_9LECA
MKWRSIRLSHWPSRSAIPNHNNPCQHTRRHNSTPRISTPNIATILTTEPTGDRQSIRVAGSVRTIRKQKHRSFLELGDGSTTHSLQAVLEPHQADGLGTGTSIEITGLWQPAPIGKEQKNELKVENIRILGRADAEKYPIQKKYHSAEYLRNLPHLRLRTPHNALLARMRSECDFCFAKYFRDRHFVRLQPPIITSSDCEGAGEVFTVSSNPPAASTKDDVAPLQDNDAAFFRDPKFLTVSSQLHLEAFVNEHQKVWTLSPTFRAERSDTPRHVSEFWMLEAEIRTESLQEVMDLVEDMIRSLTLHLYGSGFTEELIHVRRGSNPPDTIGDAYHSGLLDQRWQGLMRSSWPRITYRNAMKRLQDAIESKEVKFQYQPLWATGLQLEHEKYLAATVGNGSPVFVTDYPNEIKPFYMLPSTMKAEKLSEHKTVACFDLLLPGMCEVVGGSLREHRLQSLTQAMRDHGLNVSDESTLSVVKNADVSPSAEKGNLDWYVDLRRYGSVPHGGFGLGFDRLLGYLAGISNIKDVIPWPRYYGRCDC